MSNTNNTNLMTITQIKNQLNVVSDEKQDIKSSLLNIIEQFQCLDHIAKSIGLIKEGFTFVNRVSWKDVLSKLEQPIDSKNENDIEMNYIIEAVLESSDQLEHELIPQLQKLRNNWMTEVILIEFVIVGLLGLVTAGVTHLLGVWSLSNVSFSLQLLIYERPIFSLLTVFIFCIGFAGMHFGIRGFVARKIIRELKKEISEFDLAGAFLKNTGFIHSIFRPDIVGFGRLNRNRLKMGQN